MKRVACSLSSSILLVGCDSPSEEGKQVEEITHLHGKTEADAIKELGKPSWSALVILQHGVILPEFYVKIHNTYPPSDPGIEGVEIKELRWDRDGYEEAVFMHKVDDQWTVLESARWADGIEF